MAPPGYLLPHRPHRADFPVPQAGLSGYVGKTGIGIRGMRERIRQFGGTFEIGPQSDGSGTIIIARLPIDGSLGEF